MADLRLAVGPGEHGWVRVPVSRTLFGATLEIVVHIVRGRKDGPTLGVLGGVHGDETGTLPIVKRFLAEVVPQRLSGTILGVASANPLALASFARIGPEQHGNTDLHTVFPGSKTGNLTQMIAHALTENVLVAVDALVDIHSGGAGGRLQKRVDFDHRLEGETQQRTLLLCRAFGFDLIHKNQLSGTASAWVNRRGLPTVNVEIGGAYLGPAGRPFEQLGVDGLMRISHALGMVDRAPVWQGRQLLFDLPSRVEVNPTAGGFLESNFESVDDLGRGVDAGTVLGRIVDPYTLETVDELVAPHAGFLFFSRYSGVVEAGTKAFGIAREETSIWL